MSAHPLAPGSCWVITDGAAGNRRQALALAEALTPSIRECVVDLRAPWSWFAPRLLPGGHMALSSNGDSLRAPWPTLVIGCGRSAAWATRQVRRWSDGRALAVQILDPRLDPGHWDLVVAPKHDQLHGDNVLTPLGSLNPVDDAWLADARDAFPGFADVPGPRLGVLLGGARHGAPVDVAAMAALLEAVKQRHAREGGSVMVVASRRTPSSILPMVRAAFHDVPGFIWAPGDDDPNPYPGVLAWADRLVVTPDSVNMLSEACATGRPVHTLVAGSLPAKLERFHAELRATRRLHDIEASTPPVQPVLRETAWVAAQVRQHLGLPES
ncbi:mitochondrial fission ELM1 family protein [Luteibacter aegosomatissinici]|uniref:mitochondrial fission ELM1 family protein n=1 Tax=Luteibacter aegosomatissinici TaxID=2911539 RepID=UPI001FF97805|nr:mitochondrial fission ELM1 family protein [Luteibacter aegosomatissinici]UPG93985.1 mitochondrial fission ELM1 family protein [Luteibacter aegosomatissinici]